MDETSSRNNAVLTAAAAAAGISLGAASLAVSLIGRRRKRRWAANPDPLEGRIPHFPTGTVQLVATADGADLHTVRAGRRSPGSGPPIVLLHGLTASMDDWGPVADRLVDRGREVLGIDLRGHGHSTLGRDRYQVSLLARDLAMVLDTLDVRNAVLVGHSMGGMVIQALAVNHAPVAAERVSGLVLVSTAARLSSLRHRITTPIAAQLPIPVPELMADSSLVLGSVALSAFGPDPSLFMLRQAVASFARCPSATRQLATAGLNGFDVADGLHTIAYPTLVIAGTRDLIVPLAESDEIARAIPGATLVPIADAGHLVIWERPDRLADLIADHAAGITASR